MANSHTLSPDSITINQLQVDAAVGILPWEKTERQMLLVDCTFSIDAALIAQSDSIEKAIDYSAVRETILNWALANRVNLIETFADRLALFLLDSFSIKQVELTVKKPTIFSDAKGVSVRILRTTSVSA